MTTNVVNWGVSFVDSEGVYNGATKGVSLGVESIYVDETSTADLNNKIITIQSISEDCIITIPDGMEGQEITIYCQYSTGNAAIAGNFKGSVSGIQYNEGELSKLIWSASEASWLIISNTGTAV